MVVPGGLLCTGDRRFWFFSAPFPLVLVLPPLLAVVSLRASTSEHADTKNSVNSPFHALG